jgi:hypothetical protein
MNNILYKILTLIGFLTFCTILLFIICRDSSHFYGIDSKYDKNIIYAGFIRAYFLLITLCTIGYGDIYPVTIRAKLFTMIFLFILVALVLNQMDAIHIFTQNTVKTTIDTSKKVEGAIKKDIQSLSTGNASI